MSHLHLATQQWPFPAQKHIGLELMSQAIKLATAFVVSDVECHGNRVEIDGATWWDIRPMVDPNEYPPAMIDQAQMAIDFGLGSGALLAHPTQPLHVQVTAKGARS